MFLDQLIQIEIFLAHELFPFLHRQIVAVDFRLLRRFFDNQRLHRLHFLDGRQFFQLVQRQLPNRIFGNFPRAQEFRLFVQVAINFIRLEIIGHIDDLQLLAAESLLRKIGAAGDDAVPTGLIVGEQENFLVTGVAVEFRDIERQRPVADAFHNQIVSGFVLRLQFLNRRVLHRKLVIQISQYFFVPENNFRVFKMPNHIPNHAFTGGKGNHAQDFESLKQFHGIGNGLLFERLKPHDVQLAMRFDDFFRLVCAAKQTQFKIIFFRPFSTHRLSSSPLFPR